MMSGITEVQIIQWYVEEGAHIEEWKPLFQYQSDKAVDDVSLRNNPSHVWMKTLTVLDYITIRGHHQEASL
jgi:hypothetical protein